MSHAPYWLIRQAEGRYVLCDFRPRLEVPQWYHERNRAYRFATADEARAFLRERETKGDAKHEVKFVRVVPTKWLRERVAKLTGALRQIADFADETTGSDEEDREQMVDIARTTLTSLEVSAAPKGGSDGE